MPLLLAIAVGLCLGWASGGDWRRLAGVEIDSSLAIVALFIVQGLARGRFVGQGWASWGILVWAVVSLGIIVWILVREAERLWLVACGTALNLLVVLANGYMPVVHGSTAASVSGVGSQGFYVITDSPVIMGALADVLALPGLSSTYYLSTGDVLLAVGAAVFLIQAMTSPDAEE